MGIGVQSVNSRKTTSKGKKLVGESFSLSDNKMRDSVSQSENRLREVNDNTEDENMENGNIISTDKSDTGCSSDEVNI